MLYFLIAFHVNKIFLSVCGSTFLFSLSAGDWKVTYTSLLSCYRQMKAATKYINCLSEAQCHHQPYGGQIL